jgi:hypothetical protein
MAITTQTQGTTTGRWVTDRDFSALTGIGRQTLANWRSADAKAGRDHAQPGFPVYRRWGRAIRYFVAPDVERGSQS